MKIKVLILLALNMVLSVGAEAAMKLPITVCSMEKETRPDGKRFIQKITISEKSVIAQYYSLTGESLGSDRGDFASPVVSETTVSVTGLTLKDGAGGDGWMDNMNIEINAKTVAFYKKGEKKSAKPIIPCPQHQPSRY